MRRHATEYVATTSSLPWALVAAHGGAAEDISDPCCLCEPSAVFAECT